MPTTPAVLVLDDGELDRVEVVLTELSADFVRLKGREIGGSETAPARLLVTSGKRALSDMPALKSSAPGAPPPVWICLHGQDFLPLRERLRALGVHFLLQSALDQASLRLLIRQLLFDGQERRGGLRLPLGDEVVWRARGRDGKARLVDLTPDTCRIDADRELAPGTSVDIGFPAALGGGDAFELRGQVLRCQPGPERSGSPRSFVAVQFDEVDGAAGKLLDALVSGERIGSRLSPLAALAALAECDDEPPVEERPGADAGACDAQPSGKPVDAVGHERRNAHRHPYEREVHAFSSVVEDTDELVFGYDLSLEGVLIKGHPGLEKDLVVTLALYGDPREEPVVVEATVVRNEARDGIAFRFDSVAEEQRRMLERLTSGTPRIESLAPERHGDSRVVLSRLRLHATRDVG